VNFEIGYKLTMIDVFEYFYAIMSKIERRREIIWIQKN